MATVPDVPRRNDAVGNSVTTIFPYTFMINDKSEIYALVDGILKTVDIDYSVQGVGVDAGGTVTFFVAPGAINVSLMDQTAFNQLSIYNANEDFPSQRVADDLNKHTRLLQQIREVLGRSLKFARKSLKKNIDVDDPTDGKFAYYDLASGLIKWATLASAGTLPDPVTIAKGGTGATTVASARAAIFDPIFTAKGDIAVAQGTSAALRLASGADGSVLVARAAAGVGIEYAKVGLAQDFVGLDLRVHPDSDKVKSQLALFGLKSVVMSDGTRYDDIIIPGTDVPLIADITVAGVGGLDTGAETASVFYELYLIGKSSTKAKVDLRLILHRAKDYLKDTSFETAQDTSRALRVVTGTVTDKIAQGFQVNTAGKVETINALLVRTGAVVGNIWFTIESDNAGSPSGTILAISDKMDAGAMALTGFQSMDQWIRFVFRNPATLATATQYHLVLQGDYARSDTIFIAWHGVVAGGYANGISKDFNGTVWGATPGANGLDRTFAIYVTRNDTALTFPSGYDQSCKLNPGFFNNSGSDFDAINVRDREVTLMSGKATGQFVNGLPHQVSLSTIIPPGRITVVGAGGITVGTGGAIVVSGIPLGYIASSSSSNRLGGMALSFNTLASDNPTASWVDFVTEYQAMYLAFAANNADFFFMGWRW